MSLSKFELQGEVVVITGGAGLLGKQYVEAVHEIGGIPVILDVNESAIKDVGCNALLCDITSEDQVSEALKAIKEEFQKVPYGLINNAAIDPKFEKSSQNTSKTRLEAYPIDFWDKELDVGLKGAFLCTKHFGAEMANNGRGSIINISSVLGHVAPNQALYSKDGLTDEEQTVKPVTYSVIKHAIIGLTRYTATYWANKGVRCNALSPGGVWNNHSEEFVQKLSKYIPLGRMAKSDEYNNAIQFLLTDASSFMTGAVLQIDGGQSTW